MTTSPGRSVTWSPLLAVEVVAPVGAGSIRRFHGSFLRLRHVHVNMALHWHHGRRRNHPTLAARTTPQDTAELITDAVLTLMAEAEIDGLTLEAVAERVGVSLRTVYRYFPDCASSPAAALARHNESVPFESPTSPDQMAPPMARSSHASTTPPDRAGRACGAGAAPYGGTPIPTDPNIEEALASACDRLPPEEAAEATAVIVYLANALAWLSLRDESGLDGHQSGAAITWAIDTLVADLRRRNQRARGVCMTDAVRHLSKASGAEQNGRPIPRTERPRRASPKCRSGTRP